MGHFTASGGAVQTVYEDSITGSLFDDRFGNVVSIDHLRRQIDPGIPRNGSALGQTEDIEFPIIPLMA
jgi:hypothetical protein